MSLETLANSQASLGGTVECIVQGLPAGLGSGMFGGADSRLAAALFGIPAVKGVEFGAGFGAARLRGSENNDPYRMEGGRVTASSNRAGGVLGGITTGMPLVVNVAFKPTASIPREQDTVDLKTMENTRLLETALRDRGVPVETHIFPHGVHGQSLADPTAFPPDRQWQISVPCAAWVERCHAWLRRNFGAPSAGEA